LKSKVFAKDSVKHNFENQKFGVLRKSYGPNAVKRTKLNIFEKFNLPNCFQKYNSSFMEELSFINLINLIKKKNLKVFKIHM
jgi:hypothetical protein